MPQIEGLTTDDFLTHARAKPTLLKYIPDEGDWHHLDKKWLCDVLYTMDTNGVQSLITIAMNARRHKLEKTQGQLVEMRPEFVEALKRCTNFSSKRRWRHHLTHYV